jgi:hypothetical protein
LSAANPKKVLKHLNMSAPPGDSKHHSFSLAIANFVVQVKSNHAKLAEVLSKRYGEFSANKSPNFIANIDWIGGERTSSLLDTQTTFQDGKLLFAASGYQGFINEIQGRGELQLSSAQPIEDIDYFLRVVFALMAHDAGGVLLHAAGIVRDGQAYLFFGHSGSGKTTACRVSERDHVILNDDLILILPSENGWQAYGTPFWNPTQIQPSNQYAPVRGMYLLVQSKQVFLDQMGSGQALAALISNVPVIPQDPIRSRQLLETLLKLQSTFPVSKLNFLPDNSFWNVISD